jgi:hypothetical protein
MKKILALILGLFISSCAIAPEVAQREAARKDLRVGKTSLYLPVIYKGYSQEGIWKQVVSTGGNFAVGGAYLNGKTYLGGYGNGKLYSYPPLNLDLDNTGEAVLGLTVFKNMVYATSENNDMAGQRTRVFKHNGGWQEVGFEGYASFFTTVWNDKLIVTSTRNLKSIDVQVSTDGHNFGRMATLGDWLWVPAVFRGELYILGHGGPAEGPGSAKAVKWNGNNFVDVPALCNTPGVTEWQSAVEHDGYFYVGSGGWTLARGSSMAAVYRFDGNSATKVKEDSAYHEVQALLSSRGRLYASFGHGFKSDVGGSKIYRMVGNSWIESGAFTSPQLYVLVETPQGYIAAGGSQGTLMVFDNATAPKGGIR